MHEHDWQPAPELNSYQTSRYRCSCGAVGRRVSGQIQPYSATHKFTAGQQFIALGIAAAEAAQACRRESDEPPVPPMRWRAHL